jgi:cyclase
LNLPASPEAGFDPDCAVLEKYFERRILMTASKPIGLLLTALISAYCFSNPAENPAELKNISDNVYVRIVSPDSNAVGNTGVVVLDHAVLVFDTHFTPEAGKEFAAQIRSVTPKPVRYVVNSHFHPDHTHGNQAFADALIIGSTITRRDVLDMDLASMKRAISTAQNQLGKLQKEAGQEGTAVQRDIKARQDYLETMSHQKIIPPTATLDDGLIIQDGKEEVKLSWLGAGHTEGDTILFLPREKIAFLGDLFFNEAIPNVQDACMLDWIQTLGEVLKLEADKFVPGHGAVGSKKDVENFREYLEEIKSLVEAAIERGANLDQVLKEIQVPAKYASYKFQDFFPSNIQKMYSEIKAQNVASGPIEGPPKAEREKPK